MRSRSGKMLWRSSKQEGHKTFAELFSNQSTEKLQAYQEMTFYLNKQALPWDGINQKSPEEHH